MLTAELAQRAGKVVCVELDRRLSPVLDETLSGFENIEIIYGDILEIDLKKLISEHFGKIPVSVCANLPYYITTPILMRLLEERLGLNSITVMVQKEAADRICASPGERQCGAITAAIHYYSWPEKLFSVPPGCSYHRQKWNRR